MKSTYCNKISVKSLKIPFCVNKNGTAWTIISVSSRVRGFIFRHNEVHNRASDGIVRQEEL